MWILELEDNLALESKIMFTALDLSWQCLGTPWVLIEGLVNGPTSAIPFYLEDMVIVWFKGLDKGRERKFEGLK